MEESLDMIRLGQNAKPRLKANYMEHVVKSSVPSMRLYATQLAQHVKKLAQRNLGRFTENNNFKNCSHLVSGLIFLENA